MNDLIRERKQILDTVQRIVETSEKYSKGLQEMKGRGFSQEGMLEKVIEISSIQSQQIRALARVAMFYVSGDAFAARLAEAWTIQHEMFEKKESEKK